MGVSADLYEAGLSISSSPQVRGRHASGSVRGPFFTDQASNGGSLLSIRLVTTNTVAGTP